VSTAGRELETRAMKWRTEHVIPASLARVERAVLDPATLDAVPRYMPTIECVQTLEHRRDGDVVERRARYRPVFTPPAFARGVSREMSEWVEHLRWDLVAHAGRYEIEPNIPPEWRRYFRGGGTYRLVCENAAATRRIVEGEIHIDVAVVGRLAERFAVRTLKRQFDGEAALLANHA
jgi:hypothetical protein